MVLIIFITLPEEESDGKTETQTNGQLNSAECIHVCECRTVCWPVQRKRLPVSPSLPPSHWMNERVMGGQGEAAGGGDETVLILIITSVEDTVHFHRGSLGNRYFLTQQ